MTPAQPDAAASLKRMLESIRAPTPPETSPTPPLSSGWEVVRETISSPDPSALALRRQLREAGLSPENLDGALAEIASLPDLQRRWSGWTSVRDRDELRIRLEALAGAESLDPALHDFILFFFRASDPTLYPPAAIALGRGVVRVPALAEWLAEYVRERGIPLVGGRISLSGARSRRRVLLAAAAACARDPQGWRRFSAVDEETPDPLVPLRSDPPLERASDLTAYLRALRILLEGREASHLLDLHATAVLRSVATDPRLPGDPPTAVGWVELLAAAVERPEGLPVHEAADLLFRMAEGRLARFALAAGDAPGSRLGDLRFVDELLKSAHRLPQPLREAFMRLADTRLDSEAATFITMRNRLWGARRRQDRQDGARARAALVSLVGGTWAEPAVPSGPGASSFTGSEEVRAPLAHLVGQLADPRAWRRMSEPSRMLAAFLILDEANHPVVEPRDFAALLDAFGYPGVERRSFSVRPGVRVLLRLSEREQSQPDAFVDASLLHTLDDEEVLLRLLSDERHGELSAALADALEHRIRMGLVTDPEYRPEALLEQLEVRRPHPDFFQLLGVLVQGRTYTRSSGEAIPLGDWLDQLHREAKAVAAMDRGVRAPVMTALPPAVDADDAARLALLAGPPPVPGAVSGTRRELRHRLAALAGHDDPEVQLEELAGLFEGGRLSAEGDRARDLRGLLRALHRSHRVDRVAEGGDARPPDVLREAEQGLAGMMRALQEARAQLVPEMLESGEESRSTTRELKRLLPGLRTTVYPLLPGAEALLLERAIASCARNLEAWSEALALVEQTWRAQLDRPDDDASRWSSTLQAVLELSPAPLRHRLLPVLWRSLVHDVAHGERSAFQAARPERLMRWAVTAGERLEDEGDRAAWLEAVADHWKALVERGLEEGLETRVSRLVRETGPRTLALLPGTDEVLERTRRWFFDCYRLADAARVSRILNLRRGQGFVAALPRDFLGFFLHYSAFWLALLIGAILMLDFGDAWRSMAEVGDVRGIAVTFGLGVVGAFGYVAAELGTRVRDAPGDHPWVNRGSRLLRALVFVTGALLYTVGVVALLWWLLSGTDEVVHGAGAVLHVIVWSGFALFVGVFFGLIAQKAT